MKKFTVVMVLGLLSSACAYNQAPVVDMAGVDHDEYQRDLAICENYAMQVDKREAAAVGAQNSAAAGAGTGAVVGLFEDGVGGAAVGAVVGAVIGSASGAVEGSLEATKDQARVLRNCLAQKGYIVYDQKL